MQFQFDYRGGSTPINTGFIHCPRCLDQLAFQQKLIIIPPDPPSLLNVRPEPYMIDEEGPDQDLFASFVSTASIFAELKVH